MAILDRIKNAWNAFRSNEDSYFNSSYDIGPASYGYRPDRSRFGRSNDRTIVTSIYNHIAIDVAAYDIRHVKVDDLERYLEDIDSKLNLCLKYEPNLDQGPRSLRQDIVMTMFESGCSVVVPVDTTLDPQRTELYDVITMRVGKVVTWYPRHVRVDLYNEAKGRREEITLEKDQVAIVENPLYAIMNEPNSVLQRLIRKLNLLDNVDDASAGKLDLIIQLPYVIKSESRKAQAQKRKEEIEFQLKGSQYGIAYTDGTEKITQLNRPAENQLLNQVKYLVEMLYAQLGITDAVMNGTADEAAMLNYYNRTVEPILDAISEAMERSFIGMTKYYRGERIWYLRDPFKLVPITDIAEIADKFTRNEILTANEIRGYMGIPPHSDPKADQLMNSNMPQFVEPSEQPLDSYGYENGSTSKESVQSLKGISQNGT